MPLYDVDFRLGRCLRAAAADAAIVLGVALAVVLLTRWHPRRFWLALPAALAVVAAPVEAVSLAAGRWAYEAAMPTIGGLGVSPLLQLPLLGPLAAAATVGRMRRAAESPPGRPRPTTLSRGDG